MTINDVNGNKHRAMQLPANIKIIPFDDLITENYGDEKYGVSLITVKSKNMVDAKEGLVKYRMFLETKCGRGNIFSSCEDKTQSELILQYESIDNSSLVSQSFYSWIPLKYINTDTKESGGILLKIINTETGFIPDSITLGSNTNYTGKDYAKELGEKPIRTYFTANKSLSLNQVDGPTSGAWGLSGSVTNVNIYCKNQSESFTIQVSKNNRCSDKHMNDAIFCGNTPTSILKIRTNQIPCDAQIALNVNPWSSSDSSTPGKKIIIVNFTKDKVSKAIVGIDERLPSICLESSHPDFYKRSHSVGKFQKDGAMCTTWLYGDSNYMFTNSHCLNNKPNVDGAFVNFNYMSNSCELNTAPENTVTVKAEKLIFDRMKPSESSGSDSAIYTLDEFDYNNAKIKYFFGGLHINPGNSELNLPLYIPQHGNGQPQSISYLNGDKHCKILALSPQNGNGSYDCDTKPAASGSPVLSQIDNSVVMLHYAAGSLNYGVLSDYLWNSVESLLPRDSNIEVLGVDSMLNSTVEIFRPAN